MAKKKRSNRILIGVIILFLLGISLSVFKRLRQGAVLSHNSSQGNDNGNGNGNGYGNGGQNQGGQGSNYIYTEDDEGNIFSIQGDEQEETPLLTPAVTPIVTIQPTVVPKVTEEIEEDIFEEEESIEQNNTRNVQEQQNVNTQNENGSGGQQSSPVQVFVPISERSVVITSQQVIPVVTKSIVKRIQNKVEEIGRGEFISKPKRTPTPTAALKVETGEQVEQIGSDTDIFYALTGSGVLLGAADGDGGRINVAPEDLRSAEVTMNTVLKKQGLALGINNEERFVLQDRGVRAVFDMPIYVNSSNHKIRIENGGEKKEMMVTPAEAIAEVIDYGHFEKSSLAMTPEIVERSGTLAYEILGKKTYLLFKKYPVNLSRSVYVDIETKEIEVGKESFFSRFVQVLAI